MEWNDLACRGVEQSGVLRAVECGVVVLWCCGVVVERWL